MVKVLCVHYNRAVKYLIVHSGCSFVETGILSYALEINPTYQDGGQIIDNYFLIIKHIIIILLLIQ